MSMKISIDDYKGLIEGNIEWLGAQPPSCERSHIIGIVRDSTNYYYPENYKEESDKRIQELKTALLKAADELESWNHQTMDEQTRKLTVKYRAIAEK